MKKRYTLSIILLLVVLTSIVLLKFQAKRIVIGLIESNTNNQVEVTIGKITVQPFKENILLGNLSVLVRNEDTESYTRAEIDKVFLDVASLWDFYSGGTLVIEKFECEGIDLTLYNGNKRDTTTHGITLQSIIQHVKTDAIRFRIQDIALRDLNVTLANDSAQAPIMLKHMYARAQNLYLSADSILQVKPLVEFHLPQQEITLPNVLSLRFDSLSFSTTDNSIQFDNLDLFTPPGGTENSYHVKADKVRLAHFNFESLYTKGSIEIDSVFLGKSSVALDWKIVPSKKTQGNQQDLPALPNMDIGSIVFNELSSNITVRTDSVRNIFTIEHASLTIDNFIHRPDSSHIIYAPRYNLLITQYSTFLGNDHSSIRFDTIQIQKHSLSLLNFIYQAEDQKQPLIQSPKFELSAVNWYELLANKRLVANEASVLNPSIVLAIKPNTKKNEKPLISTELVASLNAIVKVNLFTLKNATALVTVIEKDLDIRVHEYNTTLRVNELLNSSTLNDAQNAFLDLSFKSLHVQNPDYSARIHDFRFTKGISNIGSIGYQSKDINTNLTDLTLGKINWNEADDILLVSGLRWARLHAAINSLPKNKARQSDERKIPEIRINTLRGGSTDIRYHHDELTVNILFDHLNLNSLAVADNLEISGVEIQGNALSVNSKSNTLQVGEFSITDDGATMRQIHFLNTERNAVNVSVDNLSLQANVPDFAKQKYELRKLDVDNLKVAYAKQDSIQQLAIDLEGNLSATDFTVEKNIVTVGTLSVDVGPLNLLNEKWTKKEIPSEDTSIKNYSMKFAHGLDTLLQSRKAVNDPEELEKDKQEKNLTITDTAAFYKKIMHIKSGATGIVLDLRNVELSAQDSTTRVKSNISAIQFNAINITTDKLSTQVSNGSVNNLVFHSDHLKNPWSILEDNYPTTAITNMKASIQTNGNLIRFERLDYSPKNTTGNVRQFEFRPLKERQQFLDERYFQTNYMHARIAAISFNQLNVERLLQDTAFHVASIHIESPDLEIGRDKTHPFLATALKPLPTNTFQNVNVKFKVDTIAVSDGKIAYTEKSRITEKEGTIKFSKMDGMVHNVKNIDLHLDDSLYISANTLFMDSARVNLKMRESYSDSLGGFLLTSSVSPFNTIVLNKALLPMVAVEFKSGHVDTLYMRAIGREYLSLGSMKFLYHDLKVEFMDKNDTSRHSLKNELLKFAANTFVVRAHNTDRTGKIFYERDRNRAVFQYWVKMILSGVTTSVGAKSNKKQIKKYLKDLNQKKLPPIEGDFDL